MHLQTRPTEFFTLFGSYIFERHGDDFPLNSGQSNSQHRRDTGEMKPADALLEPARPCQQIDHWTGA